MAVIRTPYGQTVDQFIQWLRKEAADARASDFDDFARLLEELYEVPQEIRDSAATDHTDMGYERAAVHLEKWLFAEAMHAYWGQRNQERATRLQWVGNNVRSRSFRR